MRLCAIGSRRKEATGEATGSCVVNKPADFVGAEGQPRPPVNLGFWAKFCEYRKEGRKIRVMFEGKNCVESSVKALAEAATPVECATAAAKDEACSKVFDFRFG